MRNELIELLSNYDLYQDIDNRLDSSNIKDDEVIYSAFRAIINRLYVLGWIN